MSDLIDRQAAIDAINKAFERVFAWDGTSPLGDKVLENVPSAQPEPSEITDEQAILHLRSTGWMQRHDKEMHESGLKERLADDSESYDSLIPHEDDGDIISRQAAIDALNGEITVTGRANAEAVRGYARLVADRLKRLPSAQPEPLTDKEQRIFLAAMGREEKVCKEVDAEMTREPYEDSLVRVCHEIIRKVKAALWET